MHKHLRMIAISEHLRNHGYTSPSDDHTRIPHIWKKLKSLYNLEALDERVCCSSFFTSVSSLNISLKENFLDGQRPEDGDSKNEPFCPFTLPEEEFGEMMFAKRFKPEGSSSPMLLPNNSSVSGGAGIRRQSAVDDTDGEPSSDSLIGNSIDLEEEPRSSPTPLRGRGSTRGARGTRRSRLHEVSIPGVTRRGNKGLEEDAVEANQKEHVENEDSVEEDSDAGKPNPRTATKPTSVTAKKRRSVRRR